MLVVMIGTVVGAALEGPNLETKILGFHAHGIQRIAKSNGECAPGRPNFDREQRWRGAASDSIEPTRRCGIASPAEEATSIECAIRAETPAHDASGKGGHGQ